MSLSSTLAYTFGPGLRPGRPALRSALRRLLCGFVVAAAMATPMGGLRAQDESPPSVEITAHHPLTGAELPAGTPYPVRGVPGDGRQDDIPVSIVISYEAFSEPSGPTSLARDLRDALLSLQIRFGGGGELDIDPGWHVASVEGDLDRNINPWGGGPLSSVFAWEGVIPAGIDVPLGRALRMQAILFRSDVPVDTFTTEIRPGMPELTFRSTIVSENIGEMEGLRITGRTSGRTGLEFAEDYLTLSGRGEVAYEDFQIEFLAANPMQNCTIDTSTQDGYFQAVQVVLFRDRLPPLVQAADSAADLAPEEVVFRLESGINESARISCPGSPVTFPIPQVLHFFAGFLSIHGGGVDGQPNELDEGRGGFVMEGWEAGEGDVIATRTYSRRGSIGPGTLIEDTVLELRWVN